MESWLLNRDKMFDVHMSNPANSVSVLLVLLIDFDGEKFFSAQS